MSAPRPSKRPEMLLASGSPYRKELLQRMRYPFRCISPAIDESPQPGETGDKLALRLARAKATSVAQQHPAAVVIGSDQVAALGNQLLGKPGNQETAVRQLTACSGKSVVFFTSVCVRREDARFEATHTDITTVNFRTLSATEIAAYVKADKPWDCAGSFKSEGLGSVLFESIDNHDPSAIIVLPVIWLSNTLREAGVPLLG